MTKPIEKGLDGMGSQVPTRTHGGELSTLLPKLLNGVPDIVKQTEKIELLSTSFTVTCRFQAFRESPNLQIFESDSIRCCVHPWSIREDRN